MTACEKAYTFLSNYLTFGLIGFCNVTMLFDFLEGLHLHHFSINSIGPLLANPLSLVAYVYIHLLPHLHLLNHLCNVSYPPT
jgi:hypothetical protein